MEPKKDSADAVPSSIVSLKEGGKREREQDEEESERRVSQRTETNNNDDDTKTPRTPMKQIILEDLRSNVEKDLATALEKLGDLLYEQNKAFYELFALQKKLHGLGGHLAVIGVMKDHPNSESIQKYGIRVINNASYKNKDLMDAFGDVEAIQVIVGALKNFPLFEELQVKGLQALTQLVFDRNKKKPHKANVKIFLVDEGGLPIVLKDIQLFANNESMVARGCDIIDSLVRVDEFRKHVFEDRICVFNVIGKASVDYKENGEIKEFAENIMEAFVEYSRAS